MVGATISLTAKPWRRLLTPPLRINRRLRTINVRRFPEEMEEMDEKFRVFLPIFPNIIRMSWIIPQRIRPDKPRSESLINWSNLMKHSMKFPFLFDWIYLHKPFHYQDVDLDLPIPTYSLFNPTRKRWRKNNRISHFTESSISSNPYEKQKKREPLLYKRMKHILLRKT